MEDFTIENADTLERPGFIRNGRLQQFDVVLANPPYSIKQWNRDAFASDLYGRNIWGTPPQGRADYAFFQHIVCSLNPKTGRCAILFPHGVLFRKEEKEMREKLVGMDVLECIIGLGPNLFFNASMEACIVICNMNKALGRRHKILFIDAKDEVTRKSASSSLEAKHISKIADAYKRFETIPNFSVVIDREVIEQHNSELRIALYLNDDKIQQTVGLDLGECIATWQNDKIAVAKTMDWLIHIIG